MPSRSATQANRSLAKYKVYRRISCGDYGLYSPHGKPALLTTVRNGQNGRVEKVSFDTVSGKTHNVVEIFNNQELAMPTVNFSVPEDVKNAFNITFEGQNKSAVIADLMREAVERAQSRQRSQDAYQRILARRKNAPRVTEEQFRAAREEGRP